MVGMCFGVLKHSSKTPENDPLTKSPKTENGRGWGWGGGSVVDGEDMFMYCNASLLLESPEKCFVKH